MDEEDWDDFTSFDNVQTGTAQTQQTEALGGFGAELGRDELTATSIEPNNPASGTNPVDIFDFDDEFQSASTGTVISGAQRNVTDEFAAQNVLAVEHSANSTVETAEPVPDRMQSVLTNASKATVLTVPAPEQAVVGPAESAIAEHVGDDPFADLVANSTQVQITSQVEIQLEELLAPSAPDALVTAQEQTHSGIEDFNTPLQQDVSAFTNVLTGSEQEAIPAQDLIPTGEDVSPSLGHSSAAAASNDPFAELVGEAPEGTALTAQTLPSAVSTCEGEQQQPTAPTAAHAPETGSAETFNNTPEPLSEQSHVDVVGKQNGDIAVISEQESAAVAVTVESAVESTIGDDWDTFAGPASDATAQEATEAAAVDQQVTGVITNDAAAPAAPSLEGFAEAPAVNPAAAGSAVVMSTATVADTEDPFAFLDEPPAVAATVTQMSSLAAGAPADVAPKSEELNAGNAVDASAVAPAGEQLSSDHDEWAGFTESPAGESVAVASLEQNLAPVEDSADAVIDPPALVETVDTEAAVVGLVGATCEAPSAAAAEPESSGVGLEAIGDLQQDADDWDTFAGPSSAPATGPVPASADNSQPNAVTLSSDTVIDESAAAALSAVVRDGEEDEWDDFAAVSTAGPTAPGALPAEDNPAAAYVTEQSASEPPVPTGPMRSESVDLGFEGPGWVDQSAGGAVEPTATVREEAVVQVDPALVQGDAADADDWDNFAGPTINATASENAAVATESEFVDQEFSSAGASGAADLGAAGPAAAPTVDELDDDFGDFDAAPTISIGHTGPLPQPAAAWAPEPEAPVGEPAVASADEDDDDWAAFEGPAHPATELETPVAVAADNSVSFAASFESQPAAAAPSAAPAAAGDDFGAFNDGGDDEWAAFESHPTSTAGDSSAAATGGFAAFDSAPAFPTSSAGTGSSSAAFAADFDNAPSVSSAASFAAFEDVTPTATSNAGAGFTAFSDASAVGSFAAFGASAQPVRSAGPVVAASLPSADFFSPTTLQAMQSQLDGADKLTSYLQSVPSVAISQDQVKAYAALSALSQSLFTPAVGSASTVLEDLKSAGNLAQPFASAQRELTGVVNASCLQPRPSPVGGSVLRMAAEVEALLLDNVPADALPLEDLAVLLDSLELRKSLRTRAAQPVLAPAHTSTSAKPAQPSSSGDKKRLSLDASAVSKSATDFKVVPEPAATNSPIDFIFGRKTPLAPSTISASSGAASPTRANGSAAGAAGSNLPPRPVATRKSSFMTLTAALSAATATVAATGVAAAPPPPAGAAAGTAAPAAIAALQEEGARSRKEEGYYGDSNAHLSPAALEFLQKLPDLSYLLS